MLLIKSKKIEFILFFATFLVYVHNLSPGVYGGDSGDFISASLTYGVPHPSGYPLYTMLGILLLKLPFIASDALKFGLVSAIFSSSSVVLLYLLIIELIENKTLAITTSLILAFSYPFWLYAEVVEVFALHSFFILSIIYLSIRYYKKNSYKYLYYISFLLGLSLTNNQSIILIFPSTLFFLLYINLHVIKKISVIFKSFLLFMVGLLPYLYIPIAASKNPEINWGAASTLENLIYLVTRQQYGWIDTSAQLSDYTPLLSLKPFLYYWSVYISFLIPIFSVLGVIQLIIKKKYLLLIYILSLLFMLGPFFIINASSEVKDVLHLAILERFVIPMLIITIILVPFGFMLLLNLIKKLLYQSIFKNKMIKLTYLVFILIPLTSFIVNFRKTDLSDIYLGDRFAKDVLDTAPKGALLLLEADQYIFNTLYYQISFNYREDLAIPSAQTSFKEVIKLSDGLSEQINIDEYSIKNRNTIERDELQTALIIGLQDNKEIFINHGNTLNFSNNKYFRSVPYGLLEKLYLQNQDLPSKEEYYLQIDNLWESYDLDRFYMNNQTINDNIILSDIRGLYIINLLSTADFIEYHYKDPQKAMEYRLKAFSIDPLFMSQLQKN